MQNLKCLLVVLLAVLSLGVASHVHAQNTVATDKAALLALYTATDGANWTTNTNWTSDEPLSSWSGVTTNSAGRVTRLELNTNGLAGTLPAALGNLSALEQLNLEDNALRGALPDELANLTHLTSLLFERSRALTGPLPDGLRELADLSTVNIADTELCAPDDDAFPAWLAAITFSGLICPPAEQSVIDVAVFYTPAAREYAGGIDEIETSIDLMAAETNAAYAQGGVNQIIELLAVEEVAYTEATGSRADLERLVNSDDGYMDEVYAIRDRIAADIVVLVRMGTGTSVAQEILVPTSSFESSAFPAFASVYFPRGSRTFAHELGHLMGLHHDRYTVCGRTCPKSAFPYVHGFIHCDETLRLDRWHTVMAYSDRCSSTGELLRFSNPAQTYREAPMGVAGLAPSTSPDGPADAVRALNRTRAYTAKFRQAPEISVSFGAPQYTATEGGSAAVATVQLSAAPTRPVSIALSATGNTGATAYDYVAVPSVVQFGATDTEQTVTVTAVNDSADDDGESVTLSFGELLPRGVGVGSQATATVVLADNDTVAGAPSVQSVSLTSDPGQAYAAGEEIEVTVRFDKTVVVTGTPQLGLTVGSVTRQASYQGGGGEVLRFNDTVADGEKDTDGVRIAADSLTLNGGTIRDSANQDAVLTHDELADDADHQVDGVKPTLLEAVVNEVQLKLRYDEPLGQPAPQAARDFNVSGVQPTDRSEVRVRGSTMTVTLAEPVSAGQEVTVTYTNSPADPSEPALIRDRAGNVAANIDRAATNETVQRVYDTDGDGLIEIATLAQLDAVRHDEDGNGVPTDWGASAYQAAFPAAFPDEDAQLRCVVRCRGYELAADLDFFDTNGDGQVDAADDTNEDGEVDAEDNEPYWNDGAGWRPFGRDTAFRATFEGNGHTIRHLFINRPASNDVGLFGKAAGSSAIRRLGIEQVDVTGAGNVGGLVGWNHSNGTITASYVTGRVAGKNSVGGLVGWLSSEAEIDTSYAAASVSAAATVGGLVGLNYSDTTITASYATGRVSGTRRVGGLVGSKSGTINASYATGRVSGENKVGGLVGSVKPLSQATASYWDTATSGQTTSAGGTGQTTPELQAPTDSSDIYQTWNDPWDFGQADEYPVLVVDFDGDGDATWEEFGYQLREGPSLTLSDTGGQVTLGWTAVATDHWDPAPDVTYTVYRATGSTGEAVAEDLTALQYADLDATRGTTYTYQVAAVVNGGEATRSGLATLIAPNQLPMFEDGTSTTRTLPENTTGDIGAPVAASDPDDGTLTYSLSGPDADAFTITATGQLQTTAALNYETKNTYAVTVSVSDGRATADIAVTITVTDVNEPPTFSAGTGTEYSVAEKTPRGQRIAGFSATDPDTETPAYADLTYRLSGSDAAAFYLDPTSGRLQTRELLDYETKRSYHVTVAIRDDPDDPRPDDTSRVTIAVTNVGEAGLVELSPSMPQENQALTATLSDPDGGLSGVTWQWAGSPDQTNWTGIAGATSHRYTPGTDDVHQYLQATVRYADGHGAGKTASQETHTRVQAAPLSGDPPEVEGPDQSEYVERGTGPVAEYTATRPAGGTLAWSLAGADNGVFTMQTGVLRFKESPDFETPRDVGADNVYQVTVQAADTTSLPGETLTGSLAVTITVADAPGRVRLPSTPPQIGTPFTATPTDPDGVGVLTAWCWARSLYRAFPLAETYVSHCEPTTTATYTPVDDDRDHYLRATATYTDGDGTPNKAAMGVAGALVSDRPQSPPPRRGGGGGPPGGGGPSPGPDPDPEPGSEPEGVLENPGPSSRQSGIGLLSGWVCEAAVVELEINNGPRVEAAYGTDRADTAGRCGDADNGFGLLFNWNLLGDGVHTVRALADGVAFGQATFTVATLGEEFVTDAAGETVVANFPSVGETVQLVWQPANQNFVLAPLDRSPPPASPPSPAGGPVGTLENPGSGSFQSGIGLLSGWVCAAGVVELEIDGGPRIAAAYGTERADTAGSCGDTDNGFGLLFNWNLLADGVYTVVAVADGEEFGRATFTVTTLGVEFLHGAQGETLVPDFPTLGEEVRLIWQPANQNFVLAPPARDTVERTGQ